MSASNQQNVTATKCSMTNPRNWTIFKYVDDELIDRMKMFYVFHSFSGSSALFVTHDDKVYGLGSNDCGVLGNGGQDFAFSPKPIPVLNGKGVKSFAHGSWHVLALTSNGDVYAWGYNQRAQLGNGEHDYSAKISGPVKICNPFGAKVVTQAASGPDFSVALTDDGELYIWGHGESCGFKNFLTVPHVAPQSEVKSVACGANSVHGMTANGHVFSYGKNNFRQLGTSSANYSNPFLESLCERKTITKLTSGPHHCLALSNEGEVFSWGKNNKGQLGRSDIFHEMGDPGMVTDINKVTDIATVYTLELSVAITHSGQVYVWGMGIRSPLLTDFNSIQEAFSRYSIQSTTYRPMIVDNSPVALAVADSLRKSFNDPATCDVKFQVDGQLIHAHRAILKVRCEHFQKMFQDHWKESTQDVVEIKDCSYNAYFAFIKYLYTDSIDTASLEELISLTELANSYFETQLSSRCSTLVKKMTTSENAVQVYLTAVKHKIAELEQFCLQFSARNLREVTKSAAFKELPHELLRNFVEGAAAEL